MVSMICNVQQYNASIAELRQEEKKLIHEANHTIKKGKLMVIAIKYQHVKRSLHFTIQDQQACFEVESFAERQWYKTHGPGEIINPGSSSEGSNFDCHQYTASIIHWHRQVKYAVSMSALDSIYSLLGYLIQRQQNCYIAAGETRRTDEYWKWYHYVPSS